MRAVPLPDGWALPNRAISTIFGPVMRALRRKPRRPHHPDDVRMSFGEHLEELRIRIIRLLLGGLVGMIGCFVFSDHLMKLILWVDPKKFYIIRTALVDELGNKTVLKFFNIEIDKGIDDTLFTFTPPPGVEIFEPPQF